MPEKTFGEVIRAERELMCFTIEEAAKLLKVDRTTLYAWETNKRKPHKRHIREIAELYAIDKKTLVELLNN